MSLTTGITPKADKIIEGINACGITHFIYLVEEGNLLIYDKISSEGKMTMVPVCREGEAFAIAAGLITGGKQPVVMIQSTGFYESGDSIRYLVLDLNLPLLILLADRGWKKGEPIIDSAAIFLEPILKAWGIKYYFVETAEDAEKIPIAFKEAQKTSKPVAMLITPEA